MLERELFERLSVDSYTAFDVETTGLDPEKDEIIEIGMVRMKSGQIEKRYQGLFKPSIPIPSHITKLTGISDADCANQPSIAQKLPEILNFLNGHCVIAHHAPFDCEFLTRAIRRVSPDADGLFYANVIDTLELCRIMLPFSSNHRLETMVESFGVPFKPQHRALADAEAAGILFHRLVLMVLELDMDTIRTISRILNGASDGLRLFFNNLEKWKTKQGPSRVMRSLNGPQNILGKKKTSAEPDSIQHLSIKEVEEFFMPGGTLSQNHPNYEPRKPQQEMAKAVTRAFNEDGILVAEAGTGVGKTLAYLVPTLFWVVRNPGQKAVVSTHTKTLQDQLFLNELPLLERCVTDSFLAVLLKGRSNYLCRARWQNLIQHLDERLTAEQRRKLLALPYWISQTRTGDIEENAGFSRESNEDIWFQINCDTRHCRNRECFHESQCFFQNVRKASRAADLVVVNHSLLFSTLDGYASTLGDCGTLIIDEAHQIEKTASQYLGITLNAKMFGEAARWLYHTKPEEAGLLVSISKIMKSSRLPRDVRIRSSQAVRRLKTLAQDIDLSASDLFQALDRHFFKANQEKSYWMKVRIRKEADLMNAVSSEMVRLRDWLKQTQLEWIAFAEFTKKNILTDDFDDSDMLREMETIDEKMQMLLDGLEHFNPPDCIHHAVWCEVAERKFKREISLRSVPIDVGGLLAQKLYPRIHRAVLTSATLAVGEKFDHVLCRWGLSRMEPERIQTRLFGSPFDYREQALFLIPTFLSNPKDPSFTKELSALLSRLMVSHPKGTLVLFTSHSMLKDVYQSVRPVLEQKGIRMLGQGIDGSRTAILRMFQQDVQSVLFGTSSFWEGVDVPGEALEILIITKIPFDVPTDPLIEARMEHVHKQSGNAFFQYAVPEAIVRFRQGFGRLIRTCEDRGVILMTDHRVVQTAYGSLFLQSLPVEAILCDDETTLMSHLNKWFTS